MKITKIWLISFSPTRTSKKVINAIGSGMRGIPCESIDITYPGRAPDILLGPDELVIIGAPVYAGRVAPLAVKRLAAVQGKNSPVVVVVTYGNREFEDALIELRDIAEQASFKPVAGCAFIGEHSFSGPEMVIAPDRPDSADLATAKSFGTQIIEKLAVLENFEAVQQLDVPGNSPYKDGGGSLPFIPTLIESKCTRCAVCLETCPSGAISLETRIEVIQELCIFCCACIKNCPEEALIIDAEPLKQKRQWLYENYSERKEPELYL